MVKIVNGTIVSEATLIPGSESSGTTDEAKVSFCGYRVPKWMPVAWLIAAFFLFGLRGVFLLSAALFVAYAAGNSRTSPSASGPQVYKNPDIRYIIFISLL